MEFISNKDARITLDFLKTKKEDQYFERKGIEEKGVKPSKVANEIIGMLNADGGVLALGISDEGEVQNLHTLDSSLTDQYRSLVFDFILPSAKVEREEVTLETGELFFLFHVEQDYERVFMRKDNEEVYLRINDTNRKLGREKSRNLEYDKGIRQYEDQIREDFDYEDMRTKVLESYKEKMKFSGSYKDLLVNRHLAVKKEGKYFFKNSAILLFSENPEKYIPSASVRYVRYQGLTEKVGISHNVIKDERFEKCIPRLIEVLQRFIYASLRDYYFFKVAEGKFVKIPEYPEEAWIEGIVNALCHRSYNIQGNPVLIKQFDDRIEISNSGPLPAQVTIENIQTERFARNPRVARVLTDMGYVRELNEGVKRIYESMEKSMLSKPEYFEKNGSVTLVLRNKIADHEKTIEEDVMKKIEQKWKEGNESERKILEYFFRFHKGSLSEIAHSIENSEKTVRSYLKKFCEEGILDRKSKKIRDKNAIYCFLKKE